MENNLCPSCGAPASGTKCEFCGAAIPVKQAAAPVAAPVAAAAPANNVLEKLGVSGSGEGPASSKDWTTALIIAIFLGYVGGDRFYVGRIGSGVIKLLIAICSLGTLAWIWWIADIIFIVTGKFTDSEGKVIRQK